MTLDEVQQRLGLTRLRETGEAGAYEAAICYVAARVGVRVTFKSSALGGAEHQLLGFTMESGGERDGCGELPPRLDREASFVVGGLRLGMTASEFRTTVGQDEVINDGRLVGRFQYRVRMTDAELEKAREMRQPSAEHPFWDHSIFVAGRFGDDKLRELTVWKTVTR